MTARDLKDLRLDLLIVDQMFKKWKDEESSLGEILNVKLTKTRNADWRCKLESWKARTNERAGIKKRFLEQEEGQSPEQLH